MGLRHIAAVSCSVFATLGPWTPGAAAEQSGARVKADPAIPERARSIGSPTRGFLVGGVELRERAELRLRWPDGPRWALPGLVSLLGKAASAVDRRYPGSILLVGDLSSRDGGSLPGHASHRSGRDADVAFYYADARGNAVRSERLLPVRASGAGPDGLYFDDARNWVLVSALLSDARARVQSIFVASALKQRLISYARHKGESAELVERADAALRQPARGRVHDDHFHVRIACPRRHDRSCLPGSAPEENASDRTVALAGTGR
jgi:penicillin-insensitive murein endopeptidase